MSAVPRARLWPTAQAPAARVLREMPSRPQPRSASAGARRQAAAVGRTPPASSSHCGGSVDDGDDSTDISCVGRSVLGRGKLHEIKTLDIPADDIEDVMDGAVSTLRDARGNCYAAEDGAEDRDPCEVELGQKRSTSRTPRSLVHVGDLCLQGADHDFDQPGECE